MNEAQRTASRLYKAAQLAQCYKSYPSFKQEIDKLLDINLASDERYALVEELNNKYASERLQGQSNLISFIRAKFSLHLGIYDNGMKLVMTTTPETDLKVKTRATVSDLLGGLATTLFS